jgi:hypothetical protein
MSTVAMEELDGLEYKKKRSEAAKKAWQTRRRNAARKQQSEAGKEDERSRKQSEAGHKAWETRRRNEQREEEERQEALRILDELQKSREGPGNSA